MQRFTIDLGLFILFCSTVSLFAEEATKDMDSTSPLSILEPSLQDQSEAERRIRAFDRLYISIARAKYMKARELEEKGATEEAKAVSDEARKQFELVKDAYLLGLSKYDNSAVLHNFYGEFLLDYLGKADEAADHWQRAVTLDGKHARAHNNLGMYWLHIGKYPEGLAHMNRALALEPDNPDYLFNMIQVYLTNYLQVMEINHWSRKEIFEEAMRLSEQTVKLAPTDFELLRDHALNYFLADDFGIVPDWKKAAEAWRAAGKHARGKVEKFNVRLNEARVHIRAENRKQAKKCLKEADALIPNNPLVQTLMEEVDR